MAIMKCEFGICDRRLTAQCCAGCTEFDEARCAPHRCSWLEGDWSNATECSYRTKTE